MSTRRGVPASSSARKRAVVLRSRAASAATSSAPPAPRRRSGQPFATTTTEDHPGEPASGLGRPGTFRVDVHAGTQAHLQHCGHSPR